MNERIKQLAEQAGIEFTYDPTETPMRAFVECWGDEMEKFAELIIQECIDTVSDCSVEYCTRPQIISEIKEHFGVEE